jgi:hypothetical protein
MPIYMYVLCAFFVALTAWGIITAVGLFRMRLWARYSVLVIGGGLAVIGMVSMLVMLVMLVMMAVPMPASTGADAAQVHAMMKIVLGCVVAVYALITAVGVFWLVYFNLKKVRDAFAGALGETVKSRRPLPISVLAVLLLTGAPCCLLAAFLPFPAALFGLMLHGWGKAAVYLAFTALAVAAGVGLWRLEEWGRRLMLALQALALVQNVVYFVCPSLLIRSIAEVNQAMNLPQQQLAAPFQSMLFRVSFGAGILLIIAIVWVLHYYRGEFKRLAESPQTKFSELL